MDQSHTAETTSRPITDLRITSVDQSQITGTTPSLPGPSPIMNLHQLINRRSRLFSDRPVTNHQKKHKTTDTGARSTDTQPSTFVHQSTNHRPRMFWTSRPIANHGYNDILLNSRPTASHGYDAIPDLPTNLGRGFWPLTPAQVNILARSVVSALSTTCKSCGFIPGFNKD